MTLSVHEQIVAAIDPRIEDLVGKGMSDSMVIAIVMDHDYPTMTPQPALAVLVPIINARLAYWGEAFGRDAKGKRRTNGAAAPPIIQSVTGPEPKGIGWQFTARTSNGNEMSLTMAPSQSGVTLVEATVDGRIVARDSHESLGSTRFRNTLAEELSALTGWRRGGGSPWYSLIDLAVTQIAQRNGIEVVQFDTATAEQAEDDHPADRLDPYVREGMNSSLIALPGRGKTRLVTAADLTLATGFAVLPGVLPPDAKPINVVHFNWENPVDLLQREAMRLARGVGIVNAVNVWFVAMSGPITTQIDRMARIIDQFDALHIDIDSFQSAIGTAGASASGGDVWGGAADGVLDAIDNVRRLTGREALSALLIDHAKGNPGAAKVDRWDRRHELVAYGSTRKNARIRASYGQMVTDRAVIDSGHLIGGTRMTTMTVGLINIKPWPDREPAQDAFYEFVFSSTGVGGKPKVIVQTASAPADVPAASGLTGLAGEIDAVIAAEGRVMSASEVAAVLGKDVETIRTTAKRAVRKGVLKEVDGGFQTLGLGVGDEGARPPTYDL